MRALRANAGTVVIGGLVVMICMVVAGGMVVASGGAVELVVAVARLRRCARRRGRERPANPLINQMFVPYRL